MHRRDEKPQNSKKRAKNRGNCIFPRFYGYIRKRLRKPFALPFFTKDQSLKFSMVSSILASMVPCICSSEEAISLLSELARV